jgi:hypothetical protein
MTHSHDCEARLKMLRETIERNREHLLDHRVEGEEEAKSKSPPAK